MTLTRQYVFQVCLWVGAVCATAYALAFLYVAISTLNYPFNLEWMEGHTVDIVQRIREGKPIYAKPTLEYIPYIYTPYYFYVSAFVSLFTGVGFFPARLVSLLATLGSTAVLYHWIRRENGDKLTACVAAGLFLATYKISGRWFDVARIDSLNVFLMVAGMYVFYFRQNLGGALLAAFLFSAAFFTKQSTALALAPPLLAVLLIHTRHGFITIAVTAALCLIGCAYFEYVSDGWFSFYVYDVPAGHGSFRYMIKNFWTGDIYRPLKIALALALFAAVMLWRQGKRSWLWYMALMAGLIGSSYAARIHSFGHVNVLIPAHWALALMSGLALHHASRLTHTAALAVPCLLAVQFYVLYYDPSRQIPSEKSIEQGYRFLDEVAKIPGDILFSELQYIQTRVGKKPYSIGMSGFDIFRSNLKEKNYVKRELQKELADAIKNKRFSAVITGRFIRIFELKGNYRLERAIDYPQEYVTGAVFFTRANVFVPIEEGKGDM